MTDLQRTPLAGDGLWAISPREGIISQDAMAEIAHNLKTVGAHAIVFRAPVRVDALSYQHILELVRRLLDTPRDQPELVEQCLDDLSVAMGELGT